MNLTYKGYEKGELVEKMEEEKPVSLGQDPDREHLITMRLIQKPKTTLTGRKNPHITKEQIQSIINRLKDPEETSAPTLTQVDRVEQILEARKQAAASAEAAKNAEEARRNADAEIDPELAILAEEKIASLSPDTTEKEPQIKEPEAKSATTPTVDLDTLLANRETSQKLIADFWES